MLKDFEALVCFAAVCKTGSFTHAADLLKCSKSHVSRQVSQLEKRVRIKLLRRTTRHIYLTEAGENLKVDATKLLLDTLTLHNRSSDLDNQVTGKFTITAPVSITTFVLSPLIPALRERFPDVQFEFIPTNENMDLIEQNIDLAIRSGSVVDDQLVAKQVGEVANGFFCAATHGATLSKLSLAELLEQPMLINQAHNKDCAIQLFDQGRSISVVPKDVVLIREYPMMVNLLQQHAYIAWLPDYCHRVPGQAPATQRLLPHIQGGTWPVYLVFPFQTPLPIKLKGICEFLQDALGEAFRHDRPTLDSPEHHKSE